MLFAWPVLSPCTEIILLVSELLPTNRPKYRKAGSPRYEAGQDEDEYNIAAECAEKQQHHGLRKTRRALQRSKTFTETIQRLRPIQVFYFLFFHDLDLCFLTAKI